ncbi:asparagine synthase C-terminal domain-containing protein [uncultured Georgenia sp.]|uniref:asparagine synthase-related protein n=1 Tax=uncultured Georgenia sp. TaxID=378209 RepID=UPI002627DCB1|nr:asparagine synthase C-terminal domain-containing protein [uncultured Georgenia sp.]HLV04716.1 asparagine synthase C-terminal domain-containing protein [Actinomycetaceae bacterium]
MTGRPVGHYERLTGSELDVVAPLGTMPPVDRPQPVDGSTRAALEQVVADSVVRGPCYVLFSGGRDSSLVLALATSAARRLGVPDPVPVTAVYPGDEHADESSWQQLVLDHLGITERIVLSITDERSTLGDVALHHLRRRGLVWPEAVHTQPVFFAQLDPGGTVLTGEGGDALLEARRVTALHLLRLHGRRASRALLRAAAASLTPTVVDRRRARRAFADPEVLPWLRPRARAVLAADEVALRGPLRWDEATWAVLDQRHTRMGLDNPVVGAAEYGLTMRHPIAEPTVVAALAAEGGRWGFPGGRTHLFRRLGADLLPDAVLARQSKAAFNRSRWTEREREFARKYTGGAFHPEYVDEERLRAGWLGDRPHPVSYFMAQVAWLRQEGLPLVPTASPRPASTSRARVGENGGPHGSRAT